MILKVSYYKSMLQAWWHGLNWADMNMDHIALENKYETKKTSRKSVAYLRITQRKKIATSADLSPFLLHTIMKKSSVLWYRCTGKNRLTIIA